MAQESSLRDLPAVDRLMNDESVQALISQYGKGAVKYVIRETLDDLRAGTGKDDAAPNIETIVDKVARAVRNLCESSLQPVINATGVVLHTNLGRAPLGEDVLKEIARIAGGYSNLEFDLEEASRGRRDVHLKSLLRLLTGAEDALVVNNNAAAIMLALNTLARDKDVIISRGELIEIGGSFRIPDIMAAAGARMVEVGTTNRTRLSDYERAITADTAMIFKAHRSNYLISGFTEEVSVKVLVKLPRKHKLPMMYAIGSGLLRRESDLPLGDEPDVRSALADGADIVSFSTDKLLGGPQAGIVTGSREYVARMASAPMMRVLRVDKIAYAGLAAVCRGFLTEGNREQTHPAFAMMSRTKEKLDRLAMSLVAELNRHGIRSCIVDSEGRVGGGAQPGLAISSRSVEVIEPAGFRTERGKLFAETVYHELLLTGAPVLGVLREGRLFFDMLSVFDRDIPVISEQVRNVIQSHRGK